MKHVLASFAAASVGLAFGASALAADLSPAPTPMYTKAPVPVVTSWTGFYVGTGVGFQSTNFTGSTVSETDNTVPSTFLTPAACAEAFPCQSQALGNTTFKFRPYLGYDYQFASQWLAGIEGDYGFGSKTSTITGMVFPGGGLFASTAYPGDSYSVKQGWDASIRGRLGFLPAPDFLVYATGGAAWQEVQTTATCSEPLIGTACGPNGFAQFAPFSITDSTAKLGYTVGGGIETLLWGHWMVRGEYRYSDFGTIRNTDSPVGGPTVVTDVKLNTQSAIAGLAYKF